MKTKLIFLLVLSFFIACSNEDEIIDFNSNEPELINNNDIMSEIMTRSLLQEDDIEYSQPIVTIGKSISYNSAEELDSLIKVYNLKRVVSESGNSQIQPFAIGHPIGGGDDGVSLRPGELKRYDVTGYHRKNDVGSGIVHFIPKKDYSAYEWVDYAGVVYKAEYDTNVKVGDLYEEESTQCGYQENPNISKTYRILRTGFGYKTINKNGKITLESYCADVYNLWGGHMRWIPAKYNYFVWSYWVNE